MKTNSKNKKILVLGAGNFGTCLAQHLASLENHVFLWSRDEHVVSSINENHQNPIYLTNYTLSTNIQAILKWEEVISFVDMIVIAIPAQGLLEIIPLLKNAWQDKLIVCAAKGIDLSSLLLPFQLMARIWGEDSLRQCSFLSGPSFASEVIEGQPTAVTLAGIDRQVVAAVQEVFHSSYFRVYTTLDVVGVEVAGALKNVIAIATGACDGLGFRENSRAALITRGLAEMTRVGVAMGANPLTFNGLAGVGDLFLTCTSTSSRNYRVGFALGKGEKLSSILEKLGSVAEGVYTAEAAYGLVKKLDVRAPIISEVYQILYKGKALKEAFSSLVTSVSKEEVEL